MGYDFLFIPPNSFYKLKHKVLIQLATQLSEKFLQVRKRTTSLCNPLKEEDTVVQPIIDVSPPKWHLGHTTWFFENFLLVKHLDGYQLYNKKLNYIFNSYYESQGDRILRSNRGNLSRPSLSEVLAYRAHVDEHMLLLLEKAEKDSSLQEWVELGLQHEMQHQELLVTDIKYILGNNPLFPVFNNKYAEEHSKVLNNNGWLNIAEGVYPIGFNGEGFHFDNEEGYHQVFLHSFEISKNLVTNKEYISFIESGGYKDFSFWLSEGWEWVKQDNKEAPLYWFNVDGKWLYYTLNGLKEIEMDEPVSHVSYYEADAFARWKGMRLPTEFEWETACKLYASEPINQTNLLESEKYHPRVQPSNTTEFIGNLWEWTSSAYLPYPYYKQAEGALGEYNGKFMVNQMVLKGGSCATPLNQIRASYRNFFHADKQWQFTGIRLAKYI